MHVRLHVVGAIEITDDDNYDDDDDDDRASASGGGVGRNILRFQGLVKILLVINIAFLKGCFIVV